jgi:glycosyltransferase involved in cell wall biosynthesis
MKVLFLADPNSIHDIKWINYFSVRDLMKAVVIPRETHWELYKSHPSELRATVLPPIKDFSIVRFYQTVLTAIRIRRIIKREEIDLINIHYAEPNGLWCLFRSYFRVPMIITSLGTDVLFAIPEACKRKTLINHIVGPAYRLAFQKADWVTATSQAQLSSITNFSGRKDRMSLIRTGVELDRLMSDTSVHFPLSDNRPYVLFPRYIKPIYNHGLCLAAIALLGSHIKAKFKMVFVGKGHGDLAYQQELERQMEQQPDTRFEFIGNQKQEAIFELYKRASLVVMTPLSDGSPVSGMEALLCGAKLILGPLNYDSEVFSRAIRMKEWDPAELASLIVRALDDRITPKLSADEVDAMDRESNMKRMLGIYQSLTESKVST